MNFKASLLLATAGLMMAPMAFAQTSTTSAASTNSSSAKIEDLKKSDEKVKDIDNEITDARMRATLGSKSRFSFKSTLAYNGGSVEDPLSGVRPNYRASATTEVMTSLSGDVGMNFRATERDNVSFGTGITIIDPFHGDITKPAQDTRTGRSGSLSRYEVSTPYVAWSRGYRAFDTQMISSLQYSHATDQDSINLTKTFGAFSFSQTVLANFGKSKWTGGASISLGKSIYTGELTDAKMIAARNSGAYKRSDLSFGLFPFAQYSFNDRYSFRTVFGYFQFARYEDYNDNFQLEPYQSVGTGISITRDIYLYPNIQFTPKDMRADRTNVALSANINLF